ncbi:recombinase family protein [Salisediminibacterium selenitireducens]|uniref:Resolvase domain protein n=1 Tax=Bacillus selenitireducens (strain ATCC 700615 / DSM 15326 / MLS10) TaxID=439292 RepID=D6XZG4_BACIE|nr:recombinase family protein [Salisediminibacterium selenitireducens]ADH98338.1 Resolvase domain protein [[Bacillus] selenitireducens MLS10]
MDQFEQGKWIRTVWDPLKEQEQSPLVGDQKVKVAAYCRVSSGSDAQINSLMNQVHYFTHYIREREHWQFAGVYIDQSVSGKDAMKQQGLQRLIRHAKEKRIDFILIKSVSRLTRNAEQVIQIVKELKEAGVGIYFEQQQIDTSVRYNEFLLSTYAALGQETIEHMGQAIRWGKEKKAKKGQAHLVPKYGYTIQKGSGKPYQIQPEEAAVVKQIFDWFEEGKGFTAISRELKQLGIPSPTGKETWHPSSVRRLLGSSTYSGTIISGKDPQPYMFSNMKEEQDLVIIENACPAIVSKEQFQRVQVRLSKKETTYTKGKRTVHPFQGRLLCHHCDATLNRYKPNPRTCKFKCYDQSVSACGTPSLSESQITEMMKEAFYKRFDFTKEKAIRALSLILKRINAQDHFEFHRLQWINEIEMKREKGNAKDVKKIEGAYRDFEAHIQEIEQDRPFRLQALAWLNECDSIKEVDEQLTAERLRAWVLRVRIVTRDHYEVTWIDGKRTTIGGRLPARKKAKTTNRKEVMKPFKGLERDVHSKGDEQMEVKRDVQVIEPKRGRDLLDYIQTTAWNAPSEKVAQDEQVATAAYCRVSTEKESQLGSLDQQVAFYTYSIMKNPAYSFAGIYVDEGISGRTTENRPGLNRLIKDCESGLVKRIVCKSLSRLSRNIVDVLEITRHLASLPDPVYIYFEREGIHTETSDSEFMLSIFGGIAEEESRNSGHMIAWGMRNQARQGNIKRRVPNYGYDSGDHDWHIRPEEAEVVRRIYQEIENGLSTRAIAMLLSELRIPTPNGRDVWNVNTIREIASSPIYKGDYVYQKYVTDYNQGRRVRKNEGDQDQIYIEFHHDPIIDRDTWERVQVVLQDRHVRHNERKKREPDIGEKRNSALEHKMYCSICGKLYKRKRDVYESHRTKYHRHYWGCDANIHQIKHVNAVCRNSRTMQQRYYEEHFMDFLQRFIPQMKTFKKQAEDTIRKIDLNDKDIERERKIRLEIDRWNHALYEAVDEQLHEKGKDAAKVEQLTTGLTVRYDQLRQLDERRLQAKEERRNLKRLLKLLNGYLDDRSEAFPQTLYEALIEKVTVYPDGALHYHLVFGIEWSTPKRYQDYLDASSKRVKHTYKRKREQLLQDPAIDEMLGYCEQPRTRKDLLAFLEQRLPLSQYRFDERIFAPLEQQGKMKRYTIKGQGRTLYYEAVKRKNP